MPRRVPGSLVQAASPLTDQGPPVVAERSLATIEEVRRVWLFNSDRRPDAYGPWAEQLP